MKKLLKEEIDILKKNLTYDMINIKEITQYLKNKSIKHLNINALLEWTEKQQEQFLEYMLKSGVLIEIFLNENEKKEFLIVDGAQKLKTIIEFIDNKIKIFKEYNEEGYLYRDIEDDILDSIMVKIYTNKLEEKRIYEWYRILNHVDIIMYKNREKSLKKILEKSKIIEEEKSKELFFNKKYSSTRIQNIFENIKDILINKDIINKKEEIQSVFSSKNEMIEFLRETGILFNVNVSRNDIMNTKIIAKKILAILTLTKQREREFEEKFSICVSEREKKAIININPSLNFQENVRGLLSMVIEEETKALREKLLELNKEVKQISGSEKVVKTLSVKSDFEEKINRIEIKRNNTDMRKGKKIRLMLYYALEKKGINLIEREGGN